MPAVILWMAVLLVAEIWVLRVAFRESTAWGILIPLLPPLGVIYAILRWEG